MREDYFNEQNNISPKSGFNNRKSCLCDSFDAAAENAPPWDEEVVTFTDGPYALQAIKRNHWVQNEKKDSSVYELKEQSNRLNTTNRIIIFSKPPAF
jgi:hypothetical protein